MRGAAAWPAAPCPVGSEARRGAGCGRSLPAPEKGCGHPPTQPQRRHLAQAVTAPFLQYFGTGTKAAFDGIAQLEQAPLTPAAPAAAAATPAAPAAAAGAAATPAAAGAGAAAARWCIPFPADPALVSACNAAVARGNAAGVSFTCVAGGSQAACLDLIRRGSADLILLGGARRLRAGGPQGWRAGPGGPRGWYLGRLQLGLPRRRAPLPAYPLRAACCASPTHPNPTQPNHGQRLPGLPRRQRAAGRP